MEAKTKNIIIFGLRNLGNYDFVEISGWETILFFGGSRGGCYQAGASRLIINNMLLTSIPAQDEESIPPGLMRPLLDCPKTNEQTLASVQLTRVLDKREYNMELFQDRVVGQFQGQASYICLEDLICFGYDVAAKTIWFQNLEDNSKQIFLAEDQDLLLQIVEPLKVLCPQVGLAAKYDLLEEVGRGKKSRVFSALRKEDNELFAIKIQTNTSSVKEQLSILRLLHHPNLIYFREYFIEGSEIHMVIDFEDGGNLLELMTTQEPLDAKEKAKIVTDMMNALEFLRVKGIVHRDLKPENILYSKSQGNFKIGDFGFATRVGSKISSTCGTPGYIAPEMFGRNKQPDQEADVKSDIYAMGLIFFELFTGKQFYEGETSQMILEKNKKGISRKKRMGSGVELNSMECDLLEKMIRSAPEKRKNSCDIVKSSTYSKFNRLCTFEYSTTGSPSKNNKSSGEEEDNDARFMNAVRKILNIRSSSSS